MRVELMSLKESAVDLLADVAADRVFRVSQRTATYAVNGSQRCTRPMGGLVAMGAAQVSNRSKDGLTRQYELTRDGREALAWHRRHASEAAADRLLDATLDPREGQS